MAGPDSALGDGSSGFRVQGLQTRLKAPQKASVLIERTTAYLYAWSTGSSGGAYECLGIRHALLLLFPVT